MSLRRFLGKDEALPFLSGPAVCTCSRILPVSGHTAFLVPVWYHWVEQGVWRKPWGSDWKASPGSSPLLFLSQIAPVISFQTKNRPLPAFPQYHVTSWEPVIRPPN